MGRGGSAKPVTKERVLSSIGLAYRASLLTSGFDAVELALHSGAVGLLILSTDGSEKQKQKLVRIAREEEVPLEEFGTSEELGRSIGRDSRIAIAILDEGFAGKLKSMIDEYSNVLPDKAE